MAKLILTKSGTFIQEMTLVKERTTIGRRAHNDLVINNLAVSGEHAVIITIYNDSFLEDLNSTNGTHVNGLPISKHFLQHNDVIQMARYKLLYQVDAEDVSKNPQPKAFPMPRPDAMLTVLSGSSVGREMALTKVLTTIGRPGLQVAIITRRPHGYELTHVEGKTYTRVNNMSLSDGAHVLKDGDVIDIGGTQMRFSWTAV